MILSLIHIYVDIGNINTDNGSIDTLTVKLLNGNNPNTYFCLLYTSGEFSEAVYGSISAGVDQTKAIKFTTDAMKLAKGGFTDGAKAVDVMTTAINGYEMCIRDRLKRDITEAGQGIMKDLDKYGNSPSGVDVYKRQV